MWVSGDKFLVYLICILSHNLNMLKDNRKKHEVLGLEQNLIIKFIIYYTDVTYLPSQVALVVKNPATNAGGPREAGDARDKVQSLAGEDPLEKEMATHFSILAWRILWTEEPGGLQSIGWQRFEHS